MTVKDRILTICSTKATTPEEKERVKLEIKELNDQDGSYEYFWDLREREAKFSENEHNLFVPYLLGLVDEFDISTLPAYTYGEFPDIDIDYLKDVRDYLKNEWAPKEFGAERVCNIGNYTTFGIRNSLIDMAKVHGEDRDEILRITTQLEMKDEEGKTLSFDGAIKSNPKLKEYCEAHPKVADSAKRLLERNRGKGKHAGGLIISSVDLSDFVPLVVDGEGLAQSAWVEGLSSQDLQPVGLVKFDLLVITNLDQIAKCVQLIKQRHNLDSICALPGQKDWSDISYLNDPKALEMANEAKLKCIFQFDSPGIRELVKGGGVTSFEDLVAYTSLYRPGPLGMGMHDRFVQRKKGLEEYELHPIIKPILGSTYGVMVYQEQVMQILNAVGNIPLKDCEIVRKAISKKKEKLFAKYKVMFVENGQKNLGWAEESVEELWSQISSFAEYGFNKSMTEDTIISTPHGLKKIKDFQRGDLVYSVNENGNIVQTEVLNLHDHGILEGYEIAFDDGYSVTCTLDHKFLTELGQIPLWKIMKDDISILCGDPNMNGDNYVKSEKRGLDSEMRDEMFDLENIERTSTGLSRMQAIGLEWDENACCTMWKGIQQRTMDGGTSKDMSRMQAIGLEGEDENEVAYCTMWKEIQHRAVDGKALQDLRDVQQDKTSEYCQKNGEVKRRQQESSKESYIFSNCEENFCPTRDTGCESGEIEEMEGRKSRKIREMHRSSPEESQKVEDGGMDEKAIKCRGWIHSLWEKSETSGFGAQQYLDRSGRSSSFHGLLAKGLGATTKYGASKRPNVERRSYSKKKCDFDKNEHGMLCLQHGFDEFGVVDHVPTYAPISDTGSLVSRKIVRVRPVGKRQMYDIEVTGSTHNFILPTGVVTSNSHAVAYTYISSRLLWMKAHYPLEFFSAILSCENDGEKIKQYKLEAEKHGVPVNPVDINKSQVKFSIVGKEGPSPDDEIYIGFSNVKGIGPEPAQRIVDGQPYASFQDFLERFGTDANVLKPLIGLNVFENPNRVLLFEFAEYYKKEKNRRADRDKRYEAGQNQKAQEMRFLLPDSHSGTDAALCTWMMHLEMTEKEWEESWLMRFTETPHDNFKAAWKVLKKYKRSLDGYQKKKAADEPITFNDYLSIRASGKLPAVPEKLREIYEDDIQTAEIQFYGFGWKHMLLKAEEYDGSYTFEDFDYAAETRDIVSRCMEVQVVEKPKKKKSKGGTEYWVVTVEDGEWRQERVTFWVEDFARFEPELSEWEESRRGNLFKMRLQRPQPPYKNYTFESPPKQLRHKLVAKEKENDNRLLMMKKPGKESKSDDELLDQVAEEF